MNLLTIRTVPTVDILPALQGEDSHGRTASRWVGSFRFVEGPGPCRGSTHHGAVSTGHAKWPLLLSSKRRVPSFPRGLRRSSADSEVPVSLPVPTYPDGGPSGFGRMHPSLSDCPGMGAAVPRRMSTASIIADKNLSEPTARIPVVNGEALRLCPFVQPRKLTDTRLINVETIASESSVRPNRSESGSRRGRILPGVDRFPMMLLP